MTKLCRSALYRSSIRSLLLPASLENVVPAFISSNLQSTATTHKLVIYRQVSVWLLYYIFMSHFALKIKSLSALNHTLDVNKGAYSVIDTFTQHNIVISLYSLGINMAVKI